ncbi:MAG: hypothetical protein ABJH08_04955 [Balneola sp.]
MKTRFIPLLALLLFSRMVSAQVIDDSSINDAQNSGYTFVEGMFVAFLADTVSPAFVRDQFQKLDITVLDEYIKPMVITIVNSPSKESLEKLRNHPKVSDFYTTPSANEKVRLEEYLSNSSLSEELKDQVRGNSAPAEMLIVQLDYSIGKKALKLMMGEFRDVAYKILSDEPKSVTIEAESGNEFVLMDKVEKLPFVESTAMVGSIGN